MKEFSEVPDIISYEEGANSHGQLGLGRVSEQVELPQAVEVEAVEVGDAGRRAVARVACGGGHSLLVDTEGKLFSCGWNHKLQLGSERADSCRFQRLWNLSGITFVNVACGWDFSCAVTQDRFLFVWGSNSHGQLGLPREHFPDRVKPVRLQVNACEVSMGLRHTAVVNSKGEVWTAGCGRRGQLGLGRDVTRSERFRRVRPLQGVSLVACGQHHTLAWSARDAALYVWGDNEHGQLLLEREKYPRVFTPERIDLDVRERVARLLSGWSCGALQLEGELVAWGRNTYGQLGASELDARRVARVRPPGGGGVRAAALGSEHGACVARDGAVWAWGWNEHGSCGAGSSDHCLRAPARVVLPPASAAAVAVFAGGAHTFLLLCERDRDADETAATVAAAAATTS